MGSVCFSSNGSWAQVAALPPNVVQEPHQITSSKQDDGDESWAPLLPKETPRACGQGTKGNGSNRSICVQLLQKSTALWRVRFLPQPKEEIQVQSNRSSLPASSWGQIYHMGPLRVTPPGSFRVTPPRFPHSHAPRSPQITPQALQNHTPKALQSHTPRVP